MYSTYTAIDAHYRDFVLNIRIYFNQIETLLWDRRNKIKILPFEDEEIVVKSFKIPHIFNRIVYSFFRASKAKKSYENSLKISAFVPKTIGYITFKKFGLLYDSYFLSENFHYDLTIREPLTQDDYPDKEKIFQAFAYFTYCLHEEGIEHLDYSPGNILIRKENDTYTFKLIDVNRMNFRVLSAKERIRNFSKLWAKEHDLAMIITAYAGYANLNTDEAITIALNASRAHKAKKNFKKRLKGKKVVD